MDESDQNVYSNPPPPSPAAEDESVPTTGAVTVTAVSSNDAPSSRERDPEERPAGDVPSAELHDSGSLSPSTCSVDVAHKGKVGYFYKAWVCVACKCFFYRHVRDQRNGIPIAKQSDPSRFAVCLKVGMDPSTVLIRTDAKSAANAAAAEALPGVPASMPMVHLPPMVPMIMGSYPMPMAAQGFPAHMHAAAGQPGQQPQQPAWVGRQAYPQQMFMQHAMMQQQAEQHALHRQMQRHLQSQQRMQGQASSPHARPQVHMQMRPAGTPVMTAQGMRWMPAMLAPAGYMPAMMSAQLSRGAPSAAPSPAPQTAPQWHPMSFDASRYLPPAMGASAPILIKRSTPGSSPKSFVLPSSSIPTSSPLDVLAQVSDETVARSAARSHGVKRSRMAYVDDDDDDSEDHAGAYSGPATKRSRLTAPAAGC